MMNGRVEVIPTDFGAALFKLVGGWRVSLSSELRCYFCIHERVVDTSNPPNVQYNLLTFVFQGFRIAPRCISSPRAVKDKLLAATFVFSGSNFILVPTPTLLDVRSTGNSRWWQQNGSSHTSGRI
jgi:hypothetical protein